MIYPRVMLQNYGIITEYSYWEIGFSGVVIYYNTFLLKSFRDIMELL